ncbi:MAG: hypothetical protein ABI462_06205 [Ignavibacteria bacterium]
MIIIEKLGRTKQDLLRSLEDIKTSFASQIQKYDLKITPVTDGFNLKANKKILFIDIYADINVVAEDGKFVINYETKNVPQSKIDEALIQVKEVLEKC